MKTPKCKYCGGKHYTYSCWKKPKKRPSKSRSKPFSKTKRYKVSSSEKYNRQKLIKELDKYCSWFVRLSESDKNGNICCITCGKKLPWRLADNCHWISRKYQMTRWDLSNVHAGCTVCNRFKNGNYEVYNRVMKKRLGADGCQKLWDKAYSGKKIPTVELSEMLIEIKQKYKDLVDERKKKGWKV